MPPELGRRGLARLTQRLGAGAAPRTLAWVLSVPRRKHPGQVPHSTRPADPWESEGRAPSGA